jgi:hypothetical protein
MGEYGGQAVAEYIATAVAAVGGAMGGLPSDPAAAYYSHPWAASIGYITASLGFEMSWNMAAGAASVGPIDSNCRQYLNQ